MLEAGRRFVMPKPNGSRTCTAGVRYPDAEHGFHCDARPAYHEASAKDAWARTLDWFATHLS